MDRLTYDAQGERVIYRSDKSEGPTVGAETVEPLEFLARVLTHIPDKGQVLTRYYGWYANRVRGRRRQAAAALRPAALPAEAPEVDPLTCPHCGGAMRVLAFVTQAAVIAPILTHLRTRTPVPSLSGARSPPARARQP